MRGERGARSALKQSLGGLVLPGSALGVVSGELRRALFLWHKAA
jgi:hypothetical protein